MLASTRARRRLLVTCSVATVLAGIGMCWPPGVMNGVPAKVEIAHEAILHGAIAKSLDAYKWSMGKYPDTDEGLAVLFKKKADVDDERYVGPYMEGTFEELKDPWGQPYEYRSPGDVNEDSYDLWSRGPDGEDDGGKEGSDDIKNWTER